MKDDNEKWGKFSEEKETKNTGISSGTTLMGIQLTPEQEARMSRMLQSAPEERVSEQEKRRFESVRGVDLTALSAQERSTMENLDKRILREQMGDSEQDKSIAGDAAEVADKVLYLASSRVDRWDAVEDIVVAHSKMGLTKIARSTDTRTLKELRGQFPNTVAGVRSRVEKLPEIGNRGKRIRNLVLGVVMAALMTQVLFTPYVVALFTAGRVYDVLVGVGALGTIAMFFIAGFWGAVIFLVVCALLMAGAEAIMPLALFGRLLVLLILGAIAIFGFVRSGKEKKLLTPERIKSRADAMAEIRAEAEKCRTYGNALIHQIDTHLKDDEALQSGRDSESRQHHREINIYIRQYRDKIQSLLRDMDSAVPKA